MTARSLRASLEAALKNDLAPLLEADGGGLELLEVDEAKRTAVLRFTGALAVCPGTAVVRDDLIEPLLRKRAGEASFSYKR
jgi:Fe-S cluster biogenesis protein NfuA